MNLRPQNFAGKLLVLFVLVVAAAQLATGIIVGRANRSQARAQVDEQLGRAARAFAQIIQDRNSLLVAGATTAARDYQVKQIFVSGDHATLRTALVSIRGTINADVVSALSYEGVTLASTLASAPQPEVLMRLIARAEEDPSPNPTATGYAYIDGELFSLAVAPLRAPDIIGWLAIGFRIDREFVKLLKAQSGVEVTAIDLQRRTLATTLPDPTAAGLTRSLPPSTVTLSSFEVPLGAERALVTARTLSTGERSHATLLLHYSLDEKLRPAREAEWVLLAVTAGSLLVAVAFSLGFARRLARPIVELVGHTRRIAQGDYRTRIGNYRLDELGRLAEAFDQMCAGLEERDRVRDLLDKNVSPEVAAQLLRDGATLGGQEREVTILFADIRGFTPMSEQLQARELLTLLNRHFDRMSAAIEREGGVIDKFIGDSIMALFGAPVAQSDAADRALRAALGMEQALSAFNAELAREGRPPLAIGIGINTARVIAGNIGTQRRLNYSVIGDGVNVAARLQTLTRQAEHRTNIITAAATVQALQQREAVPLRPLGAVTVKGRAGSIEIFAVGE